ncbi:hypothetical protein CW702_02410 [Candidatus Bathyarchaeota archaeon]|nr:MAG: hypothetical protein CW702_02410 [Candidatus Bathyarchaeota archaeon]
MEAKILLTTSRRPTRRIRTFLHDLNAVIPGSFRVNRGKASVDDLADEAAWRGISKVIIVDRWKGGPGRIRLFQLTETKLKEVPPRIYIRGIKLQREFGTKERPKINLLAARQPSFKGHDAERFVRSLSEFLEVPLLSPHETLEQGAEMRLTLNEEDQITLTFYLFPKGREVGPRIRVSHLIWSV